MAKWRYKPDCMCNRCVHNRLGALRSLRRLRSDLLELERWAIASASGAYSTAVSLVDAEIARVKGKGKLTLTKEVS